MTLEDHVVRNIIRRLLHGEDYRVEIVTLIDAQFLQCAVAFFKKVVDAKLSHKGIDIDWYKATMLGESVSSNDIAIHAGLNKKTITNMYRSATRDIVIDASQQHYEQIRAVINELATIEDINLSLHIRFDKVSVELDVNESLIVINSLAVKRAAIRGGLWSTAGKQVEGPLMVALCRLFHVSACHYEMKPPLKKFARGKVNREVDFFLKTTHPHPKDYRCEVKLMGKGNPESADSIFARSSHVFVADTLSLQNKQQLDDASVQWVALGDPHGYRKFGDVLSALHIPFTAPDRGRIDGMLDDIIYTIETSPDDS
ncbi:MAG: CfrBI family restriction endonuclease [Alphaproteobacteria bacterium GM7ARS4]|nr:CfrBI family restriction endonuclease [Alphaproteobacteria bacterium GM7ARS4]